MIGSVKGATSFNLDYNPLQGKYMGVQFYKQSGQWELVEPVSLQLRNTSFGADEEASQQILEYLFVFKRNPTFYVTVIILPSIILGLMSMLSFLIPPHSGDKVSLGVTLLLSLTVELLVISDILPPSSTSDFPIIGEMVMFLVALVALSVVISVFVSAIYETPPDTKIPKAVAVVYNSICSKQNRVNSEVRPKDEKKVLKVQPVQTRMMSRLSDVTSVADDDVREDQADAEVWQKLACRLNKLSFYVYLLMFVVGNGYFLIASTSE